MDVSGILRDSLVLSHALPCQMIATAVQHTVFDQCVANGIRQLRFRDSAQSRSRPAGSPLQGEGRRFETVSTHQLIQSAMWAVPPGSDSTLRSAGPRTE